MRRGAIVDIDGVLHMVWSPRGVVASRSITYCGITARDKIEAQTGLMTCVACVVMRAYDMRRLS